MGSKTSMYLGYTNWAPGYPRNMFTRMPLGTLCAESRNGNWYDSKCDVVSHYVCQL